MHIVQLLPELKQGGVETVVLGLNRELVGLGHQSTVISQGGRLVERIEQDGGQHITLDVCSKSLLTFPARVRALEKTLRALRPAPCILHVHSRVPAWLTRFANRKLQLPFIATVHGFNSISRYSAIMTTGNRVICVSHPVKAYIRENYGIPDARIAVIHPGIDPSLFDPARVDPAAVAALRQRFGLEGKRTFTSIGRITALKDFETFIRAIAAAHTTNPAIRGLIVGHVRADKQAYFESLQHLIAELGMDGVVHLATDLADMLAVYALSDAVVSCSKKPESFGLTLIEALAMNTPVIATRHGGPLDIIHEGENGAFFTPGDSAGLTALLVDLRLAVARNLRADTLERFSLHRMAQDTVRIYAEVVEAPQ